MSKRDHNVLSNRAFLKALYKYYDGAKNCWLCGKEIEQPEWHHIMAVKVGGMDTMHNIIPLCHECHTAITHMKPVTSYRSHEAAKLTGRKAIFPENYEAVLEDYTRCRISKSEAAVRLKKPSVRFNDEKFLKEYKKEKGILRYRNNLDIYMSKHDFVPDGYHIGFIQYESGIIEDLYWKAEEPISGASSIPTKYRDEERSIAQREEEHRKYLDELSIVNSAGIELLKIPKNKKGVTCRS